MSTTVSPSTPGTNAQALCEAQGVSHDFKLPNGNPLHVLEDINLAVRPNEIMALLGPSGCGKSTILRILAGLIRPTKGTVLYHGKELHGLNPGMAMVFQSFALYPWMTVTENISTVLVASGLPRAAVKERAEQVIRLVGLAGFEEAYPRELSGGMKQRIGMARALSVDPEILLMDEPFSQVDALTAESLRAEVIDIWSARKRTLSSILLVSHDIKEVVYMADRIVVLGANPGRIRTIVEIPIPRPRDYRSPQLLGLVDQLHDIITRTELPDVPAPAAPTGLAPIVPLPEATSSEIVGLLEYLDARGGKQDIFRIAAETNRQFDEMIRVVRAAELLDYVDTPKRMVVFEPEGQRFVRATPEERKAIWREHLLRLRLFHDIHEVLRREPNHEIDRDFVLETIVMHMPQENYEKIFATFIRWARFGDLFAYDEKTQMIALQEPARAVAV
jgi:NitT/TauT family transport system ATP-binding protein